MEVFRRDEEVDNASLSSLTDVVNNGHQGYTFEEHALVKRGMDFFDIGLQSDKATQLKSPDARVSLKEVQLDLDSDRVLAGIVQATIHTDPASCVAYEFDKELREKMSKLKSRKVTHQSVKKLNSHAQLYRSVRATGVPGFSSRDTQLKAVWKKDDDGTFWIVYEDVKFEGENGQVHAHTGYSDTQILRYSDTLIPPLLHNNTVLAARFTRRTRSSQMRSLPLQKITFVARFM